MGVILLLLACDRDEAREARPRGPEPEIAPAPATLRRLTHAQYVATLDDAFGPGLVLPANLEPDTATEGLYSVGAGQAALSPYGVEQFESAAYLVVEQVLADPDRAARALPCDPDAGRQCLEAAIATTGRHLWRRTLTASELATLADLAETAADVLADASDEPGREGFGFALAGLLQSPNFLYRVEVGEEGVFSGPELASRMSYLLWGGPPDDALLDLAEAGDLADPEVRRDEAARLLADPRATRGVRALFDEVLGLGALDGLSKDPTVFVHFSDQLGPSAREETLLLVEELWREDLDFRDLVTAGFTNLDPTLAALYGVRAPTREGFGRVSLAEAQGERIGLFGHASFLAVAAHPVSTSVTRRGMYVRERLLCGEIPPPPADVDTSIPPASGETPTMRERVAEHLQNPVCASCHRLTDPLGLALEHFDGLGRWRPDDDGYAIDASGSLELPGDREVAFDGLAGLAAAVHDHPDFSRCLATQVLRLANGHLLSEGEGGEEGLADWLDAGFRAEDARGRSGSLQGLLLDVVASEGFAVSGSAE